jgi:small subunit ribosomal protein S5
MEEENKVVTAPAAEENTSEQPRGREPHGSASAPRPGDRKDGSHRGRPSERRGGRGGFRRDGDDLLERVVAINRVSKTVQGGKHVRFSALTVVGDGKGSYGFATAKSGEVPDAIKKSLAQAQKKMYRIHIVKGGTIAHEVEGKFGATKVVLKPARPGTGIIAGGAVRTILELAGIKNVVSKVYGSRTSINVIRATAAGLEQLKDYGKTMVLRGLKTEEEIKALQPKVAPKAAPKADTKGDKE